MRILFAGSEGRNPQLKKVGVRNVLTSYLTWNSRPLDDGIKEFDFLVVDSGSQVYYAAEPKLGKPTVKKSHLLTLEKYVENYIKWLKENRKDFNYFTEIDIGSLNRFITDGKQRYGRGRTWVLETRQKFIDAGLKDQLMPVYRKEYLSLDDFAEMCQQFDYVALARMTKVSEYNELFDIAKKYNTKLHGFGMNKDDFIKKLPFYSIDTTSWLAGSRFGTTYSFKGTKLTQTDDKSIRRTMKQKLESNGINFLSVIEDKSPSVDTMNALAWREYEDYLNKRNRAYWTEGLMPNDPIAQLDEEGNVIRPFNPADNFPEHTRGKIMEIRQDKDIEAKRVDAHQEAMRENTFAWKTGQFSAYKKTPDSLHRYLEELDDLDFSDPEQLRGAVEYLLKQNLKRIAINQFFELSDGGTQDRALSALIRDTTTLIKDLGGLDAPTKAPPQTGDTNIEFNIGDTKGLSDDQRLTARAAIGEALARITDKTKK